MTEETLLWHCVSHCYLTSCLYTASRNVLEGDRSCAWERVKEEKVPQTPGPAAEGNGGCPIACFCGVIFVEVLWVLE